MDCCIEIEIFLANICVDEGFIRAIYLTKDEDYLSLSKIFLEIVIAIVEGDEDFYLDPNDVNSYFACYFRNNFDRKYFYYNGLYRYFSQYLRELFPNNSILKLGEDNYARKLFSRRILKN